MGATVRRGTWGVPVRRGRRGSITASRGRRTPAIPPAAEDPETRHPAPEREWDEPADARSSTTTAEPEVDEEALDAKWGFAPEEPLVGFGAPPVVAVMVTADPGDWFEATLESLAEQDYESLSVLIIDNAGTADPTPRVAEVLPSAFVKRVDTDRGFSAAANEALVSVEGAAFYLFLHDDVRLDPSAVTSLVAEAFRANGGIVGPKLVDWADPRMLSSVGYSVDPYGFSSSISEPGELDQSQHDTPREVFAVSDACLLVRSDLHESLGGFNESVPYFGEDIDLCWRAHVAAATVHLCPSAVVAHRNRFDERRDAENRQRLELRHEARSMLSNYELFRLVRVLPVVALLSLVDLVGSLVVGRVHRAGDIVASWSWNLWNLPSLLGARSRVKRSRRAHDAEYLPLMRQGSSRLRTLVRADEGENRLAVAAQAGRGYFQELTTSSSRYGVALAVLATLLILAGARDLFTGPIPVIREFIDAGPSSSALLAQWWSAWREPGLGEAAVAPGVVPGLGILGTLLLGSLGLARRLLVLAPLFIGSVGAWKLFARDGSTRVRAGALAVYGLNPVVLNAVAEGRLQALVAYGAAPWVLRRVARGAGVEPFAEPGEVRQPRPRLLAGLALALALVAAITPLGALVLVVTVALMSVVVLLGGDRGGGSRMLGSILLAALLAVPVTLPWLVAAVTSGDAATLTGVWTGRGATSSAAELITGSIGPVAVGLFGWGLLVAAGFAIASGTSWRLRWAVAGWVVAVLSWGLTIALAGSGTLAGAGPELFLVPAVLGMAISVAMGAAAFERDVVGADFGLAQLLSAVALAGLLLWLVPVGVAAVDGRWYQPEGGFSRVLADVDDGSDFRTVWIGDPDVLPLSGWELSSLDGLAVGTSVGLDPLITQRYRLDGGDGVRSLAEGVDAALTGQTSRLGRVLAPMGVRYLVVVDRPAPEPFGDREVPVPDGAVAALREQLDLREITLTSGLVLFEVADAWPLRSDVTDLELPEGGDDLLAEQLRTPLASPPAVLGSGTGTRFDGELEPGRRIAQAETADSGWSLTVDGTTAEREPLLGWQQQYVTEPGGAAELSWSTPALSRGLQAVQVLALVALLVVALRRRRLVAPAGRRRRRRIEEPLVVVAPDGELLSGDRAVVADPSADAPSGPVATSDRVDSGDRAAPSDRAGVDRASSSNPEDAS